MTDFSHLERDERFMRRALELAREAASLGEVPVGAVVVMDGEIISEAYNRRELDKNALAHAELLAIDKACAKLGGWRLHKCELYVTLEPCPMCAGAIVNSRIKRVVFGAKDTKAGAFGTVLNLNDFPLNHKPEIVSGVCEEECAALLSDFFKILRAKKLATKKSEIRPN
jgi:tRNA(adenine34) deaminase